MKKNSKCYSLIGIVAMTMLCSSCYTVGIEALGGSGVTDLSNRSDNPLERGLEVHDTTMVMRLKIIDSKGFVRLPNCDPEKGFYAIEYRVTLGDLIVNTLHFGKHRKVRVKYICTK